MPDIIRSGSPIRQDVDDTPKEAQKDEQNVFYSCDESEIPVYNSHLLDIGDALTHVSTFLAFGDMITLAVSSGSCHSTFFYFANVLIILNQKFN